MALIFLYMHLFLSGLNTEAEIFVILIQTQISFHRFISLSAHALHVLIVKIINIFTAYVHVVNFRYFLIHAFERRGLDFVKGTVAHNLEEFSADARGHCE